MGSTSASENLPSTSKLTSTQNESAGSQILVISPNQLERLGLSTQIQSIIETQVYTKKTTLGEESVTSNFTEELRDQTRLSCKTYFKKAKSESYLTKTIALNEKVVDIMNKDTSSDSTTCLRTEMKSKLYHLLNANPNVDEPFVLNSPAAQHTFRTVEQFDFCNNNNENTVIKNKRQFLQNPSHSTLIDLPGSTGVERISIHHKDPTAQNNFGQQNTKSVPRIITSTPKADVLKTVPKLEIVSNEVVNFSATEIQNILKHNVPYFDAKMKDISPQSAANTIINKTAYLQNSISSLDVRTNKVEKHYKKKLYETFHVTDKASVEKRSETADDKCNQIINLDNIQEDSTNSGSGQSIKLTSRHRKNDFLPPTRTFVFNQANAKVNIKILTVQNSQDCEPLCKPSKPEVLQLPNFQIEHREEVLLNTLPVVEEKSTLLKKNKTNVPFERDYNSLEVHLEEEKTKSAPQLGNLQAPKTINTTVEKNTNYPEKAKINTAPHLLNLEDPKKHLAKNETKVYEKRIEVQQKAITTKEAPYLVELKAPKKILQQKNETNVPFEKDINFPDVHHKEDELKVAPHLLNLQPPPKNNTEVEKNTDRPEEVKINTASHLLNLENPKRHLEKNQTKVYRITELHHTAIKTKAAPCLVDLKAPNKLLQKKNETRVSHERYNNYPEVETKAVPILLNLQAPQQRNFPKENSSISCTPKKRTVESLLVGENIKLDKKSLKEDVTAPKRKYLKRSPTVDTPKAEYCYVQSRTSGRRRKYVDYNLLHGNTRRSYDSVDSDSANEDIPLKKKSFTMNNSKLPSDKCDLFAEDKNCKVESVDMESINGDEDVHIQSIDMPEVETNAMEKTQMIDRPNVVDVNTRELESNSEVDTERNQSDLAVDLMNISEDQSKSVVKKRRGRKPKAVVLDVMKVDSDHETEAEKETENISQDKDLLSHDESLLETSLLESVEEKSREQKPKAVLLAESNIAAEKDIQNISQDKDLLCHDEPLLETSLVESVEEKRRGRKPEAVLLAESNIAAEKETENISQDKDLLSHDELLEETSLVESVEEKRRGRKPEAVLLAESNVAAEKETENESLDKDLLTHDESLETSAVESVEKKRRGRKPKPVLLLESKIASEKETENISQDKDLLTHDDSLETSLVESVEKKRRGRKPKAVLLAESNIEAEKETENISQEKDLLTHAESLLGTSLVDSVEKKRRGRKPKAVLLAESNIETETESNNIGGENSLLIDDELMNTSVIESVEKKRRGRKPKIVIDKIAEVEEESQNIRLEMNMSVNDSPEKKRRGRPPKSIASNKINTNYITEAVKGSQDIKQEKSLLVQRKLRERKSKPEELSNISKEKIVLMDDESIDTSIIESVEEKRKGRKTVVAKESQNIRATKTILTDNDISVTEPVEKKRRGRKPKSLEKKIDFDDCVTEVEQEQNINEDKDLSTNEPMNISATSLVGKKRRGRKPKTAVLEVNKVQSDCEEKVENESPLETSEIQSEKKKRGRKPKADVESVKDLQIVKVEERSRDTLKIESKKRVGRKPKMVVDENQSDSDPLLENGNDLIDTPARKQRGRKRKAVELDESVSESAAEPESVTCAVCNDPLLKSQWTVHKRMKHNNLAWHVNEDPLDLSDQDLVTTILTNLCKNKKVLYCETCGCTKKSVAAFLSHTEKCSEKQGAEDSLRQMTNKKGSMSEVLNTLFSSMSVPSKQRDPLQNPDIAPNSVSTEKCEPSVLAETTFTDEMILPAVGRNEVRCAVCKTVMLKSQWSLHKQKKHNNLAWRDGDKPVDLQNRTLVMRVLTDLCKRKKALFCETCGVGKKSVLGFLSHKSQCQKSDNEIEAMKVKCELCSRMMLPVSLQRHLVLSHSTITTESEISSALADSAVYPQGKRRAANKAAGLIHNFARECSNETGNTRFKKYVKNVNFRSIEAAIYKFSEDIQKNSYAKCVFDECNFRTSELEDLFCHIENCDKNSDTNYTCNFCFATFRKRQGVRQHINEHHNNEEGAIIHDFSSDNEFKSEPDNDDDDDDNDGDEDMSDSEVSKTTTGDQGIQFVDMGAFSIQRSRRNQSNLNKRVNRRIHFLQRRTKQPTSIFIYAYWWMEKYCQENYNQENIFAGIYLKKEDWIQLDPTHILKYLPKLKLSADTARIKINNIVNPINYEYEWKKYKLFESEILDDDGTSIIFCGGPVNAMAWVPTPYTESNCDQLLAISVLPDPDESYYTNTIYKGLGLIQFWNFGVLQNKEVSTYQPKLEFCIAHDYGVIWWMEWCPSGCYDLGVECSSIKKLGLLAVACSDCFVYIYTVLYPNQISGSIFKTKPTFRLQLEIFTDLTIGEIDYYSTRLSWTKNIGHQFLAVGYSNGVAAIYDLKTQTSLLRSEVDGIIILQPIQKFRPHLDAVTALALHHLHDGKRWLLTGSLDRDCKLWDLENTSEPINCWKKFIITDTVWMLHWLCSIYSYDHGCISGAVPTTVNPARDFFASCTSFMPSNSRVTSLSANEWANLFLQANDCGEVVCCFPDQLLQGYDCDKKKSIRKARCIASYTGMVEKSIPSLERIKVESSRLEALRIRALKLHSGKNTDEHVPENVNAGATSSEPRTYSEAEDKYGLVFCDLNMDYKLKEPTAELDKLLQTTHYFSLAKPDMYPLQSITKVSSNPNKKSFLYYACGYQIGLVRVSNIRFLCPDVVRN